MVWLVWQQPRLKQPLVRGKYPKGVPWTKAAREAYRADPRCRLVIEHLEPIKVLVCRLLDGPLEPERVADELRTGVNYCVITPEEDKLLAAAGVGTSSPDPADPWARYRVAGIDVASLAPLE